MTHIIQVLLDKELSPSRIVTSQPVSVEDNFVFVVDLSKLEKPEDIRADDLGSWTCNGKRSLHCIFEGNVLTEIVAPSKLRTGKTYCLVKRYYKHATAGDFKRTIAEIYGDYMHVQVYSMYFAHVNGRYCWYFVVWVPLVKVTGYHGGWLF